MKNLFAIFVLANLTLNAFSMNPSELQESPPSKKRFSIIVNTPEKTVQSFAEIGALLQYVYNGKLLTVTVEFTEDFSIVHA